MNAKRIGLIIGPLLFLGILNLPLELLSETGDAVIGVACWMVAWWITEAVSISVTALLPLLLFPLLNIMPIDEVGANYGSPIVFLFFGGFIMAMALEKVNLHKRIALNIIRLTGTTPNKVILGFMIATAVLSMWISNTASTVVMLPIAISVIKLLMEDADGFTKEDQNFALSVMLGIAFSANAGGIATVIGTPPNSVLIGLLENEYNIEISFLKWMTLGLPFSILMVSTCYLVLVKWMFPNKNLRFNASKDVINVELEKLGATSGKENLGLTDTMISIFAAITLFAIPYNFRKGDFIIEWRDTKNLAWGILILFGGGLALAKGMSVSGIVDIVAKAIASSDVSIIFTAALLIFLMLFMTELMSNVALVAVLAPVVAGIALGLDIPLLYLLIPVTIASSCAFMLPMATPPNAIVFASGYIKVYEMARVGIILNLIAVIFLILVFQFIIPYLF